MIDPFIQALFSPRDYTPEVIFLYILAGILAGLTRLIIRNHDKANFRMWWNDGSLAGAIIISVVGALLIDNDFVWAFLGGYFITYILQYIQKGLDKITKGEGKKDE